MLRLRYITIDYLYVLNNNLGGVSFGITEDGQPGWKDGADTVHPFKSGLKKVGSFVPQSSGITSGNINLSSLPNYRDLTINSFILVPTGTVAYYMTADFASSSSDTKGNMKITKSYNPNNGILNAGFYFTYQYNSAFLFRISLAFDIYILI